MTYKTQEIIAKCLKQFDLRLFEEIGWNVQEKIQNRMDEQNKKSTFRAFASRANKFVHSVVLLMYWRSGALPRISENLS